MFMPNSSKDQHQRSALGLFFKFVVIFFALVVPEMAHAKKKSRKEQSAMFGLGGIYSYHNGFGYGTEAFFLLGPYFQLGTIRSLTEDYLSTSAPSDASSGLVVDTVQLKTSISLWTLRWFPLGGSFNILLGTGTRTVEGRMEVIALDTPSERVHTNNTITAKGMVFAVGNQWRTRGFYLAIDWFGQMRPQSADIDSKTTATGVLADYSTEYNSAMTEAFQAVSMEKTQFGTISIGILL